MRDHRVHTEGQCPLSGVHSNMMEKLAQAGEGGGARLFNISTITNKVVVYASAEREGTLPLFLLYLYMYSVCVIIISVHTIYHC